MEAVSGAPEHVEGGTTVHRLHSGLSEPPGGAQGQCL